MPRDQQGHSGTLGQTMQTTLMVSDGGIDDCGGILRFTEESPCESVTELNRSSRYHGDNNLGPGAAARDNYSANFEDTLNWSAEPDYLPGDSVSMNGILKNLGTMQDALGYNPSDSTSNAHDLEISSENPSDRPTPASSAHSDARSNLNLQRGQSQNGRSGQPNFETSPTTTQDNSDPNVKLQGVWSHADVEYPSAEGNVGMTPGRYSAGNDWQTQSMTPIGEGAFRELMGMEPTEHLNWESTML